MTALPREIYGFLKDSLNDEQKAIQLFNVFEELWKDLENKTEKEIINKKEEIKAKVYNNLRNELATKEFVKAEIKASELRIYEKLDELKDKFERKFENVNKRFMEIYNEISGIKREIFEIKSEIKSIKLLIKVFIGLTIFAVSVINPNFIRLVEILIK